MDDDPVTEPEDARAARAGRSTARAANPSAAQRLAIALGTAPAPEEGAGP